MIALYMCGFSLILVEVPVKLTQSILEQSNLEKNNPGEKKSQK